MELINNEAKKDLVATNCDYQFHGEIDMYTQAAKKPKTLLRNGAYGIVMRVCKNAHGGVHRKGVEKGCRYVVSN